MSSAADTITPAQVHLGVTGMTCTSCSNRVERKLNKVAGVHAQVNFATEQAAVTYDPQATDVDELIAVVEGAGYGAFALGGEGAASPGEEDPVTAARDREARELARRTAWSAALSVPIMAVSMVPAWQFLHW